MRRLFNQVYRSVFARRAGGFAAASMIGQLTWFASWMVMGRFYPVDGVGVYQVFYSYAAILGPILLLGYQIVIPHISDREFQALTKATLVLITVGALLTASSFVVAGYDHALLLATYVWAVGLSTLAESINLRDEAFRLMYVMQVLRPLAFLGWLLASHLGGVFPVTGFMLIVGHTLTSAVVGTAYIALTVWGMTLSTPWHECWAVCLDKRRVPIFVMPSLVLSSLSFNLPTILLERFFGPAWAAHYGLVLRFCQAPVTLIGYGVAQVFHSEFAKDIREATGEGLERYLQVHRVLSWVGLAVAIGIVGLYPTLFDLFLGSNWAPAGRIAQILAPLFGIMLVVLPLSRGLHVFEKHATVLGFQIAHLVITVVSFWIGISVGNAWVGIVLFSALSTLRYVGIDVYTGRIMRSDPQLENV